MTTTNDPTAGPVHLPVLPTGRQEALRRQMQEQAPTAGTETPTPPVADVVLEPVPTAAEAAPAAAAATDAASVVELKLLEGKVIEAIQTIYDPEIPVNIYELGLIYKIDVKPDKSVAVEMTLTAPACPVAGTLPGEVEKKIESIPEVKSAAVELVWDPPWSRDMMSEAAQLQLGLM